MSRIKLKQKGITYTFLIEQNIYDRLLREVKGNNLVHPVGKNHLKLDVVLFFVNLITSEKHEQYLYLPVFLNDYLYISSFFLL